MQRQLLGVQAGLGAMQKQVSDTLARQLDVLTEANARRLQEMRLTLETQMTQLQQSNAGKLDEMRQTVDEKLHATLQQRLGESFRQVAERLEMVYKGLGEMQTLAQGVGDLRHLSVKTRGMFGEAQLGALLEQVFSPEQYAAQVQVHPGSRQAVDFAIRLPGKEDGTPLWLPIDAKFPNEDYERLLQAQQQADPGAADAAARQLEARVRTEARSIAERYIAPPHTTDFAILFLPTEGHMPKCCAEPVSSRGCSATSTSLWQVRQLCWPCSTPADGIPNPGARKAQQRGMAGSGGGQNRIRQVRRCPGGRIRKRAQVVMNTLDQAEVPEPGHAARLRSAEALPDEHVLGLEGVGRERLPQRRRKRHSHPRGV